jgi:D-tyrosyl-tRNA(Tyr) deacylase
MRVVIQRVASARVEVEGKVSGEIAGGILALLGVAKGDTEQDADYLAGKVVELRIFRDERGRMNRSLLETGGGLLVVSQFTLCGDVRKGRRPSFDSAAAPDEAKRLYAYFVQRARSLGAAVQTGIFQAMMSVFLINDGPVTFVIDSPPKEREL